MVGEIVRNRKNLKQETHLQRPVCQKYPRDRTSSLRSQVLASCAANVTLQRFDIENFMDFTISIF